MRDLAKATALKDRAQAEGLDIDVVQLDVTDGDSVAAAIGAIEDRHGAIDVLVNNAGNARQGRGRDHQRHVGCQSRTGTQYGGFY